MLFIASLKKISFALALSLLLLAAFSSAARAIPEYSTISDDNGGVIITQYNGPGGAVNIPSIIGGLTVTGILGPADNTGAFEQNEAVTSVTIPSTVTYIANYAFYDTGLTTVTIPATVTDMGSFSFGNCQSLTAINVDPANPSFSSVNGVLFNKNQTSLITYPCGLGGNYTIPNTVTYIDAAFFRNSRLTGVTIPNSVTQLSGAVFYNDTSLTSLVLPDSVTQVGTQLCESCTSLASLTLSKNLTQMGLNTFDQTALTSIVIPASLPEIGPGSFAFTPLTSVTITNGVTEIGGGAFNGCHQLASITIPGSISDLDGGAFQGCTSLTSATFLGNAPVTVGSSPFDLTASPTFKLSYYNGATGFTSPTWDDGAGDTYATINLGNPPDVFGGTSVGTNLDYSSWFGYYAPGSYPLVYQYYLGYEYAFPSGSGVYLYDYGSGHFWYTQSSYFPFLYDFSLNAFLYYYDANTPHRHFYNFNTQAVITL